MSPRGSDAVEDAGAVLCSAERSGLAARQKAQIFEAVNRQMRKACPGSEQGASPAVFDPSPKAIRLRL
jgi:hypothetical protein